MGGGDMAWVGHWLDTPFLSPEPHPQTAFISECSSVVYVEQGKVGVVGVTWVELGVASSCKGRASQIDSGVDVAGEKKVTLLHAQGGE